MPLVVGRSPRCQMRIFVNAPGDSNLNSDWMSNVTLCFFFSVTDLNDARFYHLTATGPVNWVNVELHII
jgi:hypothetical protein